jgi:hypothetical protein
MFEHSPRKIIRHVIEEAWYLTFALILEENFTRGCEFSTGEGGGGRNAC